MIETMIDVESLSKYYPPDIRAVNNISFKVRREDDIFDAGTEWRWKNHDG